MWYPRYHRNYGLYKKSKFVGHTVDILADLAILGVVNTMCNRNKTSKLPVGEKPKKDRANRDEQGNLLLGKKVKKEKKNKEIDYFNSNKRLAEQTKEHTIET